MAAILFLFWGLFIVELVAGVCVLPSLIPLKPMFSGGALKIRAHFAPKLKLPFGQRTGQGREARKIGLYMFFDHDQ
jgi:hypothetical protein